MSSLAIRFQGTEAQFRQFEHQCRVTELMLARTLCDRFHISTTQENLEMVASWMASARSMGIGNHLTSGIKMELVDENALPELPGLGAIRRERVRQIYHLGHSLNNDDAYTQGQMVSGAATYLEAARIQEMFGDDPDAEQQAAIRTQLDDVIDKNWPWEESRPNLEAGPVSNLVKAAAMIAAELDRRDRF